MAGQMPFQYKNHSLLSYASTNSEWLHVTTWVPCKQNILLWKSCNTDWNFILLWIVDIDFRNCPSWDLKNEKPNSRNTLIWLERNKNDAIYIKHLALNSFISKYKWGLSKSILIPTSKWLPQEPSLKEKGTECEHGFNFSSSHLDYINWQLVTPLCFRGVVCKGGMLMPSSWGCFLYIKSNHKHKVSERILIHCWPSINYTSLYKVRGMCTYAY